MSFSSLLIKNKERAPLRWGAAGMLSAFVNNALFALSITYVFRYEYWLARGFSKVFQHIFISASIVTVITAFVVPLGFFIGKN